MSEDPNPAHPTTSVKSSKVFKPYRRARLFLLVLSLAIGAGAGYEIGWGWGAAIASALLSGYFLVVLVVAIIGGLALLVKETVQEAFKALTKAIENLHGTVIKKDDLLELLAEHCEDDDE